MSDRWTETDYALYLARTSKQPLPKETPEGVLLAEIRKLAKLNGFETFHVYDSRRSEYGYPDLTLVKPGRLIFAELKSRQGKLTHEQFVWLDLLKHSVQGVEVYCWRPSDWETITQTLAR